MVFLGYDRDGNLPERLVIYVFTGSMSAENAVESLFSILQCGGCNREREGRKNYFAFHANV